MSNLKTVDIKGKDYVMVHERIRAFREAYPSYGLNSEIISLGDGVVTMKAVITDENGRALATGHAQEKESSSYINKTSYIENCETSAFGRALGALGIGIDTSFATADEVANAIKQQEDLKREEKSRKASEERHADDINKDFQKNMDAIPMATEKQIHEMRDLLIALGQDEDKFLKAKKISCLEEISEKVAEQMIIKMKQRLEE